MSGWDVYADTLVGDTYCCHNADSVNIIGNDNSVWISPEHKNHLKISFEEAQTINAAMADWDNVAAKFANGIFIGGKKYRFLRKDDDDNVVVGKLKDEGSITLQKATSCIVIAHTEEGKQQGTVNAGVFKMCEYLKSVGY